MRRHRHRVAVIHRLRRLFATSTGLRLALASVAAWLAIGPATPALALDVSDPIVNTNGVLSFNSSTTLSNNTNGTAAGLSATLAVSSGGTNLTSAADDNVMVGNGTTWQSKALTTCTGAGKAVTYDASTNAWGCNTISGTSPWNGTIVMNSETKIALGASATLYMDLAGRLCASESDCRTPVNGGTYNNIVCLGTGGGTGTATVTMGSGTCTSTATYTSTPAATLSTTANTASSVGTGTLAPSSGQCMVAKIATQSASSISSGYLKCSIERTA